MHPSEEEDPFCFSDWNVGAFATCSDLFWMQLAAATEQQQQRGMSGLVRQELLWLRKPFSVGGNCAWEVAACLRRGGFLVGADYI